MFLSVSRAFKERDGSVCYASRAFKERDGSVFSVSRATPRDGLRVRAAIPCLEGLVGGGPESNVIMLYYTMLCYAMLCYAIL